MRRYAIAALILVMAFALGACSRAEAPLGPDSGGAGGSALDFDLVVEAGSIVSASDVAGTLVNVADALEARTTSALPSGYQGIQGMHFTPEIPRDAGFAGRLTVLISAGSPAAGEYDGVLLYLFYIDPATHAAQVMDAARGNASNRVTFALDGLGYLVIAENLAIPRPNEQFWLSAFADLALAPEATTINFTAIAHGGVAPTTYAWDMGDGTKLNGPSVAHAYAADGEYNVTVSATDATGVVAPTVSTPLTITHVPVPLQGVAVAVTPNPSNNLTFGYLSTITGGEGPFTLEWDFNGDGIVDSNANGVVQYTFIQSGLYAGTLTVTDVNNATDHADFVSDARLLKLDADLIAGDAPLLVNFTLTAEGFDAADPIHVDFGDGESVDNTAATFTHTYVAPGTYTAQASGTSTLNSQQYDITSNDLVFVAVEVVIPPTIQVTQPILPQANSEMDIYGFGFGAEQAARTITLGTLELTVTSWTPTRIRVHLPAAVPGTRSLLRISGPTLDSNSIYVTTSATSVPAAIQNVIPFAGMAANRVLIVGHGFGVTPVAVTCVGVDCTVEEWSKNAILARLPAGAGGSGDAPISVALPNGTVSFLASLSVGPITPPQLDSVTPAVAEVGVDNAQLDGSNFGDGYGGITFSQGLVLATNSWSDTSIVLADPVTTIDSWIVVINQDKVSNALDLVIIRRPAITALVPPEASVGDTIDVQGSAFGEEQVAGYHVTLGALDMAIVSWSDTLIRAIVPSGALDGDVVVHTRLDSNGMPLNIVPQTPGPPDGEQL